VSRGSFWQHLGEGLSHLTQESFGALDCLVRRQVAYPILQMLLNPLGQLALLVIPRKSLIKNIKNNDKTTTTTTTAAVIPIPIFI